MSITTQVVIHLKLRPHLRPKCCRNVPGTLFHIRRTYQQLIETLMYQVKQICIINKFEIYF